MWVTVILFVVSALGTVPRGLEQLEFGRRIVTIRITVLLKLARIPRKVLGDLKRLTVTPMKAQLLTFVGKTCNAMNKEINEKHLKRIN